MNVRAWLLVVAAACGGAKGGGPVATTTDNSDVSAGSGVPATGSGSAEELTGVGAALDVTPRDAAVTIDGVMMGKASELDPVVALAPGLHTLVVSLHGFKSYRAEFAVTDKVEKFVVKLEPQQ